MKLGYLGPLGSYSYEAACLHAKNAVEPVESIALPSFAAIIDGVEQGWLDGGILPVENSTHGAVATAMDILLKLKRGSVGGEIVLNVEHCLLGKGYKREGIKHIYSHEQALAQCSNYFAVHYPSADFIACASTTQACELVQNGETACAAIAGKMAARHYNLAVLDTNIQDNVFNQTRFFLIGREQPEPTGQDKTSIVFAFPDDCPGNLYKILKSFAAVGVNLTRIESRPAKQLMGKYIFHLDFLGHRQETVIAALLTKLKGQVSWLKVLGSYPVDISKVWENGG